jgi:hypothetical protein
MVPWPAPRLLIGLTVLLASCGSGSGESPDGGAFDFCFPGGCDRGDGGAPFSIVVLPDTQFYAQTYHHVFKAQTRWILEQREARRIAFVLHEGDIVNIDLEDQWKVAAESMHALDGKVPYVLSVGNHDYTFREGRITRECDLLNRYFPAADLAASPWPTGTFEPGRIENHYQVLSAFGWTYLVLSLEFGPRDAVVAWADQVLERYAALPAIIVTHAYLARGDQRFDKQIFHACGPGANEFTDCNDGQTLWDKLIAGHDNVVFVFSGHDLFPGVGRLTSQRASGKQVHQMLANYQTCGGLPCIIPGTDQLTEGGDGFLRIITIDPGRRTAEVESFSPYFERLGRPAFRTDPPHRFTLKLDAWQFRPPEPRAAVAWEPRPSGHLTVRTPLDGVQALKPQAQGLEQRRSCDGIQVVLAGVEAVEAPASVRRLRACLDGACARFAIDEGLACVPVGDPSSISCVNDEGMLRLFFFGATHARPRVEVVAEDAGGQVVFRGADLVRARAGGDCWTAVEPLSGALPGRGTSRPGI